MPPEVSTKLLILFVVVAVTLGAVARWFRLWTMWRFWLGMLGLFFLPGLLLLAMQLSRSGGGGAGFSGAYAGAGVGKALVLSLYVSPVLGLAGFLVGWLIDRWRTAAKIAPEK